MDDENERLPPLPDDKKTKTNEKECQSGEEITRARDEIAAMKKAMTSLKSKYMKTVVRLQRTVVEDKMEMSAEDEWEKEFLIASNSPTASGPARPLGSKNVAGNRRSDIFFILSVLGITEDVDTITEGSKSTHYYNTSCQFLAPIKHKQLDKRENYLTCSEWHSHYNCEVVLHPFFVGDTVRVNADMGPFRHKTGIIDQIVGAETVSVTFEEEIDGVPWKEKKDFDVDDIDLVTRSVSNKNVAAVEAVVVVWKFDGFQTHSMGYCKAAVPIDASMAVPFEGWLELKKNRHLCKTPTFLTEWVKMEGKGRRADDDGNGNVPHPKLLSSSRRPRAATLAAESSSAKHRSSSFVVPSPKSKGKRHSLPTSPKRGDDGKTYVFVRGMFYDPSHSMAFESDRLRRESREEMDAVRNFVKSKARRYSALERDFCEEADVVASLRERENQTLAELRAQMDEVEEDSQSRLESEESACRNEIEDARRRAETLDVAFDMLREQSEEKYSNARDACVKLRSALKMAEKRARTKETLWSDEWKEATNEADRLREALECAKRERAQLEESTRRNLARQEERLEMKEMASGADLSALRERLHLEEIELHGKLANADRQRQKLEHEVDGARSKYEARIFNKVAARRTQELLTKKLREKSTRLKHCEARLGRSEETTRRLERESVDLASCVKEIRSALLECRNERTCELRAQCEAADSVVESLHARLSLSESGHAEIADALDRQRKEFAAEMRAQRERSETSSRVESELASRVHDLQGQLIEASRNSFALQTMRQRMDAECREFEVRVSRENAVARAYARELEDSRDELRVSRTREKTTASALRKKNRQVVAASASLRAELARRIDLRGDLSDERSRVEFFVEKLGGNGGGVIGGLG